MRFMQTYWCVGAGGRWWCCYAWVCVWGGLLLSCRPTCWVVVRGVSKGFEGERWHDGRHNTTPLYQVTPGGLAGGLAGYCFTQSSPNGGWMLLCTSRGIQTKTANAVWRSPSPVRAVLAVLWENVLMFLHRQVLLTTQNCHLRMSTHEEDLQQYLCL